MIRSRLILHNNASAKKLLPWHGGQPPGILHSSGISRGIYGDGVKIVRAKCEESIMKGAPRSQAENYKGSPSRRPLVVLSPKPKGLTLGKPAIIVTATIITITTVTTLAVIVVIIVPMRLPELTSDTDGRRPRHRRAIDKDICRPVTA